MTTTPLIFLPGFACQPWIWDEVAEALQRPFQAIAWPDGDTVQQLTEAILPTLPADAIVIGHSMGGLVGLELLNRHLIRKLVMVESFVTPPPPFFQNLMLPDHPLLPRVQEMLKQEKLRYPATLAESLKQVDSLQLAQSLQGRIVAIYGDRGSGDPENVRKQLGWPESLAIPVQVIPNTCHFPMLENSQSLKSALGAILDGH